MTPTTVKSLRLIAAGISILLLLLVGLGVYIDVATPKAYRYLIPEGFAGWLCVSYTVANAPELPLEDGFRVVRFPETGIVETSSESMAGDSKNEFYYYSHEQRRALNVGRELGGGYTVTGVETPDHHTFKFWVSRNAQTDYETYVKGKSDGCGPFPGYSSAGRHSTREARESGVRLPL